MDGLTRLRLRLSASASWRPEGDGFLLYDVSRDSLSRGNATGRLVFESIEAGRTLEHAVASLSVRHGLARERVRADVSAFARSLLAVGLLEEVGDEAS